MGWTGVRSAGMTALRRLRSAGGGAVVVLTYHRVTEDGGPEGASITPERFREHVEAFARRYHLMTVGALAQALAERTALPRRGLCITLDDGYADSLGTALPVLSAHGAPATVFACSGFIDDPREFWWDELERLVLLAPELPRRIAIATAGVRFDREVPSEARGTGSPAARRRLYDELSGVVEPLSSTECESVLKRLREQTGQKRLVRAEKRPLSLPELRRLADSGLVEVGAHTVNHVRLGSRPIEEQRAEIEGSKMRLEEMLGRPVRTFSYPYGTRGAFTSETERLVSDAEFIGAVTAQLGRRLPWGSVSGGSDRFALPRTATSDIPASRLTALIDKRLGL